MRGSGAGRTFTNLYRLLRTWVDEERAPWDPIRRRLRFVGIIKRTHTSPNTWRWQQHVEWTRELPTHAVLNVSIDRPLWNYLGNDLTKLTRSFHPTLWTTEDGDGPRHDDATRQGRGRSRRTRDAWPCSTPGRSWPASWPASRRSASRRYAASSLTGTAPGPEVADTRTAARRLRTEVERRRALDRASSPAAWLRPR
jgi:hypothetical protein